MKSKSIRFFVCTIFFIAFLNSSGKISNGKEPLKNTIGFIENKGQITDQNGLVRPDVLFAGNDGQMSFHIKQNGISYQLYSDKEVKNIEDSFTGENTNEVVSKLIYRVDITWPGANSNLQKVTGSSFPGVTNYYLPQCPDGLHNVITYHDFTLKNIYSNIDLHYYIKDQHLKYDYIVAPHADYKKIRLEVKGAKIKQASGGELILITPLGNIVEDKPIVYQDGKELIAKWIVNENTLSFEIENYNPNKELIIDPASRVWGTYYGGTSVEWGYASTIDPSGNVFLSGWADSNSGIAIATSGAHQTTYGGGFQDAFIVKFDPNGVRLWGTYYGGTGNDKGWACSADALGNVYLAGETGGAGSSNLSTPGSHQQYSFGNSRSFLVKFNGSGSRIWGTYYGADFIRGCAVDANDNVYITGETSASNYVSTTGAHQFIHGGSAGTYDAFLAKFNPAGVLQWGTFYGGLGNDRGEYCAVDALGNVFITGRTGSSDGTSIASNSSHQSVWGGGSDAFIAKFNSSGTRQWGSYYGGTGNDAGYSCTTDASGGVYICGSTNSSNANVISSSGSHQPAMGGGSFDGFIVRFNSAGVRQWGTYYGGNSSDYAHGCVSDATGNLYVVGESVSSGAGAIIATPGSHQSVKDALQDAFLVMFNNLGIRQWGTYYGGSDSDFGNSVVLNSSGQIYLSGVTKSTNGTAIATASSHQNTFGGGVDGFIVKFGCPTFDIAASANSSICNGSPIFLTSTVANNSGLSFSWNGPSSFTSSNQNPTITVAQPSHSGTYTVTVSDGSGCTESAVVTITVSVTNVSVAASASVLCIGNTATLTASNGSSSYTWSPSTGLNTSIGNQVIATPANTTTYIVTGGNGQCLATGSVVITVATFTDFLLSTPNPKICETNSTNIFASGADIFQFTPLTGLSNINSGSVTANPISSTNYTVIGIKTIGDVTCSYSKEIHIEVVPNINATISKSVAICYGQSVKLMSAGGNNYEWSPKESLSDPYVSSPLANTKATTVYSVNVSNSGFCVQVATVLVVVNPKPQVSAGKDIISNIDEPIHLNANGNGVLTWVSGEKIICANCPNTQVIPSKSGCYKVEAVNEFGCKAEDEVCVEIEITGNYNIYIPNVFTPNGDGSNDVFMVYGTGLSKVEMIIFDRWGEKLFTSKDQQIGWNGFFKGELCKDDAYTYQVKYQSLDGKAHTRTGHVTLMK